VKRFVQAGTTGVDADAVRQAMCRQRIKSPSGFEVVTNTNHHLSKPVMIGKPGGLTTKRFEGPPER
jgi:urea transport system substrate-binding protein